MKLREIAWTRSGDKGNISNVVVYAFDDADYERLREHVTVDAVRELYGPLVKGDITRYEFRGVRGLNFVMTDALEGGTSNNLLVDPHGKCYQTLMLELELPG
jgi:hypothetical protein